MRSHSCGDAGDGGGHRVEAAMDMALHSTHRGLFARAEAPQFERNSTDPRKRGEDDSARQQPAWADVVFAEVERGHS